MRILHILDHSLPLQSGYTFRTLAILREQRALGWQTFHLTGGKQGRCTLMEETVDGWDFYRTPPAPTSLSALPVFSQIGMMADLTSRLEELARDLCPTLLHAHSPVLNALPALYVGRRLGIPVVYEVRAFWEDAAVDHGTQREWGLRYRATRALETFALKRADAVTTICEGLRTDIVARGVAPEKVWVIPNAVDLRRFGEGGPADAELRRSLGLEGAAVLGFIGSFYAYEGLDLLLEALPAILQQAPHARVLLVGGGPQEAALKAKAQVLGLDGKVVFTGRVPHDAVTRYYDLIDLLVYPRRRLRLTELVTPLKPLEAMAQGRLLLASDVGGHRELVADGETGVLFRAGDAADLAAKAVALLSDTARWPTLKAAARRYVESERSWPASVARYQAVYGSLSGRPLGGQTASAT